MISAAGRVRRMNTKYQGDFLPSSRTNIPRFLKPPVPQLSEEAAAELDLPVDASGESDDSVTCTPGPPETFTSPDKFGVYRVYQYLPSREPDEEIKSEHLADSPHIVGAEPRSRPGWWFGLGSVEQTIIRRRNPTSSDYAPFLNQTTLALMRWFYQARTSTMSLASVQRLVDNVIFSDDWNREHLRGFKATAANVAYDRARKSHDNAPASSQDDSAPTDQELPFASSAGWHSSSVQFWVPKESRRKREDDLDPKHMTVGPVWHRKIMDVLTDAIQNPKTGPDMHLTPFRMYWNPDAARDENSPELPPSTSYPSSPLDSNQSSSDHHSVPYGGEQLYGEVYMGDAMNREHEEIRKNIPKTHAKPYPETVVAAILLYSDSTRLAQFGKASLWPAYCWFGNWTKYDRGKPSSFAAHHLAYIPSVRISLSSS